MTKRKPGASRLPEVGEADIEGLAHLNADEKELARLNKKSIPNSNGWWIMTNDPELQAFWAMSEREFIALIGDDFQGIPLGPMNLICLEVTRLSGNDYQMGVFRHITHLQIKVFDKPFSDHRKLAMIEYPDSKVFTDAERLVLKFTRAFITQKMTDELFDQAVEAWGIKKTLRYSAWAGYVNTWCMTSSMLDMKFQPDNALMDPMPPELIKGAIAVMPKAAEAVKKLWIAMGQFGKG